MEQASQSMVDSNALYRWLAERWKNNTFLISNRSWIFCKNYTHEYNLIQVTPFPSNTSKFFGIYSTCHFLENEERRLLSSPRFSTWACLVASKKGVESVDCEQTHVDWKSDWRTNWLLALERGRLRECDEKLQLVSLQQKTITWRLTLFPPLSSPVSRIWGLHHIVENCNSMEIWLSDFACLGTLAI
jgi:hypothetical protein